MKKSIQNKNTSDCPVCGGTKKVKVIIFDKIRDNRNFDSEKDLKEQIKIDVVTIKNLKDYVLTF